MQHSQVKRAYAGRIAAAAALALVLGLAGCAQPAQSQSSASASSAVAVSDQSASQSASASASASSTAAQSTPEVKWNKVATASDAAKGAGIKTFGVFTKLTIHDMEFQNPEYSFADGVVQAAYETGATGLYVRKADGAHTAPLTDRAESEFAKKWTQEYEGYELSLFGPAEGAATVFTWKDGSKEYGVTFQGLGGEEMTMESDEVAQVVKGIKDAEVKAASSSKSSSSASAASSTSSATTATATNNAADDSADDSDNTPVSNYISEDDAKSIAVSALGLGLPEQVYATLVEGGDAPHYVVDLSYGSEQHTVEIDAYTGEVWSSETTYVEETDTSADEQVDANDTAEADTDASADESTDTGADEAVDEGADEAVDEGADAGADEVAEDDGASESEE